MIRRSLFYKSCQALLIITLLNLTPAALAQSPSDDAALQRLEREIARLAKVGGGTVGVTAIHIETGRRVSLNGKERFPMASTVKVPIAVQLFARVDKGEVRLDDMIKVEAKDLHPGSGTISDLFNKPGLALSVRNLTELMLLISDNSATDLVLRLAGGGGQVTARMKASGIDGISVDRSTANLIADWVGITNLPPENEWTQELFSARAEAIKPEERAAAAKRFDSDPRDTSTPDGMADLLVRIHRKEILKQQSADLLLDIMLRCRTGDARLKGLLPQGTDVAHKTGTIGGSTNDVGIIKLPDGTHVAIAAFVKSSEKEIPVRERAIAEIARAVHDFFLFLPR